MTHQRYGWKKSVFDLLQSQLPGVIVGGLIAALTTIWIVAPAERDWTKRSLASALIGEIGETANVRQNRYARFAKDILARVEQGDFEWEPIGQPPERLFVIYEATADKLGLLGPKLCETIARFYVAENGLRESDRFFGDGRFMKLNPENRKIWLRAYVKRQEELVLDANKAVSELREISPAAGQ